MNFHEHKREAYSVAWSPITKDTFASSSWDGTVKIVWQFSSFFFCNNIYHISLQKANTGRFEVVTCQKRIPQDAACGQLYL